MSYESYFLAVDQGGRLGAEVRESVSEVGSWFVLFECLLEGEILVLDYGLIY